jgi:hypothetical protein
MPPEQDEQVTPKGVKIPVPARKKFFSDLERVVKAPPPEKDPKPSGGRRRKGPVE